MSAFDLYMHGIEHGISGKSDRSAQRGSSGGDDTTAPISQGVCSTFDNLRYFYNTSAGQVVLEMEGPLVHGDVFAGGILVVCI